MRTATDHGPCADCGKGIMTCSRCNDDLPLDALPSVRTCRDYADMIARERGDMLDEAMHNDLMLMRLFCALDYAIANDEAELTNDFGELKMKLSKKELTKAIARYARRHGHYASTVRTMTVLRMAAITEWCDDAK